MDPIQDYTKKFKEHLHYHEQDQLYGGCNAGSPSLIGVPEQGWLQIAQSSEASLWF